MEILYIALKTTFPLLFIMSVGYIAKSVGFIGKNEITGINKLVYWILLPALLFKSVYQPALYQLSNIRLLSFAVIATACVMGLSIFLTPKILKDQKKIGVIIQGLIRGNVLYFGIPVISTLLGEEALGLISIVIVALVPMYNIVSVIVLEKYAGEASDLKGLLVKLFKNPLIISALIGMGLILLKIDLPALIMTPIISITKATTPTALILLGAAIELNFSKEDLKQVLGVTLIKLVVIPLLVIAAAILVGLNSEEIVTVFAVFAAPTAVASYSLAREMGADYDLSGQIVFMTTICSVVTIFIGTVLLQRATIL
jgi:predicted permease